MAKQLPRCELLKSQPLTQAAASHRRNGADDDNIYLTGLPREANATACAEALWELHGACPARWHCHSQNKIVNGRVGRARTRVDVISRSRTGGQQDKWAQDHSGPLQAETVLSLAQCLAKYITGAQYMCAGLMHVSKRAETEINPALHLPHLHHFLS